MSAALIDAARAALIELDAIHPQNMGAHVYRAREDLRTALAAAQAPLTDEQIQALVLATVYEGDSSTAHRDAWAAEIGIPFARAIEAAHGIGSKP